MLGYLSLSIAFLLLFNPAVKGQVVEDKLFFSVTYRDFLPAGCFFNMGNAAFEQFERDAWDRNVDPNNLDACREIRNDNVWRQAILDGTISGSPDFEAGQQHEDSVECIGQGKAFSGGLDFPVGFCGDAGQELFSMVNRATQTDSGGLNLPRYCQDGINDSCGFVANGRRTHTRKEFFDLWYNDDIKFNRRTGQIMALRRLGNSDVFEFDSLEEDNPAVGLTPDNQVSPNFFDPFVRFNRLEVDDLNRNIRNFPIWPLTDPDLFVNSGNRNAGQNFWLTTELHTTFEFSKDIDMIFTFSGDDDFWAYVNKQLVMDLGGLHPRREGTVDLNAEQNGFSISEFLGLEEGEIYDLDIFHAERQRGASNFAMTTTLIPACNVQQSASNFFDFSNNVDIDDFITAGFDLQQGSSSFQLTANNRAFQASRIFSRNVLNFEKGFITSFEVSTSGPAEGFAFVVQAQGANDLPTTSGSGLNFAGITNSFAVVFDLCVDRAEGDQCQERDVRVHFPNNADDANNAEEGTKRNFAKNFMRSLDRGENMEVEIIYFGGSPDTLEVFIDGSLYIRQSGFDIEEVIGGTAAHVGITASTSSISGGIEVSNFKLDIVDFVAGETLELFIEEELEVQEIDADGETESEGVAFQTRDFCVENINNGGLADEFDAKFVEQPNASGVYFDGALVPEVVEGIIVDENDGSYTVKMVTETPGNYSMFVAFGNDCEVVVEEAPSNVDSLFVPNVNFQGADCFESFLESIVLANEVNVNDTGIDDFILGEGFDVGPIAAAVGGVFFLALIAGFIFVRYREKWRRERNFIEDGERLRLEQATAMAGGDEYTSTGRQILAQQLEISELKSRAANDERAAEIAALKQENSSMKDLIKAEKQASTVKASTREVQTKAKPKKNKYGKVDF